MANISTAISLTDNISSKLQSITVRLNSMTTAFETVSRASENIVETNAIVNDINSVESELNQLEKNLQDVENQASKSSASMNGFGGALKKLALGFVSLKGAQSVLETSDELTLTTARINMMNDGLQSTPELMQMIYQSAQNARGSFDDMASVVARFGNNAKDAFGSSKEVVQFANLVQKQMTIAGAGTQEAANAMLQLSQALGSGVLRGDELNSIFEQAPNLIQSIATYLDKPIGKIREMAADGQLTADVVKAAIFASADDIEQKFNEMPMTWGQAVQRFQNFALMAFQPVLNNVNEIVNDPRFNDFLSGAMNAISVMANIAYEVFNVIADVAVFIQDNWSIIAPIIEGIIAAIVAWQIEQAVLNAIMNANPIFLIVTAVGVLIGLIMLLCNWIAKSTNLANSGIGIVTGSLAVAGAFVGNIFIAFYNLAMDIIGIIWNFMAALANFFGNVFKDPIGSIVRLFASMADTVLSILQSIANAIDTVFGSNLASNVQGWRDSLNGKVEEKFGKGDEIVAKYDASKAHLDRFNYGDSFKSGAAFGDKISNKFSSGSLSVPANDFGFDTSMIEGINNNTDQTAKNTSKQVDVSNEHLAYLRDIAEQEAINRFTTAEVKVEMTNNNNVNSSIDLDGMISSLSAGVEEAMMMAAEGV